MSETSAVASPKKILIVRLGAMGDVIHAIPAVVMLRGAFPNAQIGWVIERRWSELLKMGPMVNRIHEVDTRKWRKNLIGNRREWMAAVRELRAEQYDVAIDFQGAMKSAAIAALSGAPRRYGFARTWEKPASLFYTHTVDTDRKHVVEQNQELAAGGVVRSGGDAESEILCRIFAFDPELDRHTNDELVRLRLSPPFAILNPGAGWGAKQWPVERFAEVARALGADGIRSLVNFGPGEEGLARAVEQQSNGHAVAASFSISQLMAITRKAALFIGGDTGPMHLAARMQVPVVALFGPTDPSRTGPYTTKSIVLRDPASVTSHKRSRETEAGLRNITTEQVLQAARELLQVKQAGVRV